MKKFSAIALLFTLAYSLGGYLILFTLQQSEIQSQVALLLKKKPNKNQERILLKFARSEAGSSFVYNNEDELLYGDQMYDVSQKTLKNDTLYFYCYHDKEEEKLYARLDGEVIKNTQNPVRQSININAPLKIFIQDYFCKYVLFSAAQIADHTGFQLLNTGKVTRGYLSGILDPPEPSQV